MRKMATSLMVVAILLVVFATSVSAEKYEVKKGDSLWNIAEQYQMSIDDLVELNDLKTTVIQPKQELIISETYIVERGDTLSHIAKDHHVKVKQIKAWNDLESDLILVGEELVIKQGKKVATSDEEKSTPDKEKSTKQESEPVAANSEKEPIKENKSEQNKQVEQKPKTNEDQKPAGETMQVTATAYTAECEGCSGVTYTGVDLLNDRNKKVIAVDPNVIPLGTKVYVEGYGYAVAEDIGSAIKGNKIDLHVATKEEAYSWGVQTVNVTILD